MADTADVLMERRPSSGDLTLTNFSHSPQNCAVQCKNAQHPIHRVSNSASIMEIGPFHTRTNVSEAGHHNHYNILFVSSSLQDHKKLTEIQTSHKSEFSR